MQKCSVCKKEKENHLFRTHRGKSRQPYCIECNKEYQKNHYIQNKDIYLRKEKERRQERKKQNIEELVKFFANKECADCGDARIAVLEFDHTEDNKAYTVSAMMSSFSWKRIQAEIRKCEVVCRNCHAIRTHTRSNSWRSLFT